MTENKPKMTVYVSDVDVVPNGSVEEVVLRDGFKHSAKKRMYEFLITVVGISHEYQLDNSDMDFECMLDHITDLDLEELAHEPIRTVEIEPVKNELRRLVSEVDVHKFTYHAPNSIIEVRYLYA
jgi:hypothetical protein